MNGFYQVIDKAYELACTTFISFGSFSFSLFDLIICMDVLFLAMWFYRRLSY